MHKLRHVPFTFPKSFNTKIFMYCNLDNLQQAIRVLPYY